MTGHPETGKRVHSYALRFTLEMKRFPHTTAGAFLKAFESFELEVLNLFFDEAPALTGSPRF